MVGDGDQRRQSQLVRPNKITEHVEQCRFQGSLDVLLPQCVATCSYAGAPSFLVVWTRSACTGDCCPLLAGIRTTSFSVVLSAHF